jgi:hypothetical protein
MTAAETATPATGTLTLATIPTPLTKKKLQKQQ